MAECRLIDGLMWRGNVLAGQAPVRERRGFFFDVVLDIRERPRDPLARPWGPTQLNNG